jgi:uncharacterized membrane-anchored protein
MAENEQNAPVTSLPTRADLAASGLSNRNQEFMYQVTKLVTNVAKQGALVAEIQDKLLAGQHAGKTAKQLYGTPAEALGMVAKAAVVDTRASSAIYASYPLWKLAVDNMLAFLMMFSAMFGLLALFSSNATKEGTAAGVISLTLTAVIGGFAFAVVTKLLGSQTVGKLLKFVGTVAIFLAWFGLYMGLAFLPSSINPVLPGWVYIIVAVLVFVGFRVWRTRTGIVGGFLGGTAQRPAK